MVEQPTGTVTFLFTDIEGSTRLLQALGEERYAEQLERHRGLLRDAFRQHGGFEVECQGDAFFVAFERAGAAVAAAGEAQRALAAHAWPEGRAVRVRIGVHTGEALVEPGDYVGADVHKAARIMAAGHGGQVLVSEPTRRLLDERFELQDLGEHQLKDLRAPERLYQLVGAGLERAFPRLRTLEGRRTNLPAPISDFIGRSREIRQVLRLLRHERRRLVTLTGVGGAGKTRLAWRVASELVDDYEDGVLQVSLSSLRDESLVLVEIARTLQVEEAPPRPLAEVLAESIGMRRLLLLLDSFDRVRPAAAEVARLLESCPGLALLVTCRTPLNVEGETVHPVPPLEPGEARDLLVSRAEAHGAALERSDPTLATIADRVDRLPLALELAAARLSLLSPGELVSKIEEAVFESGRLEYAPTRQQTIRSMIDWSHELMSEDEQRLFARLSVFAAPAPLAALETVCEASLATLAALLGAGFVRRLESADGAARFVLPELMRTYARERLGRSGEEGRVGRAHAEYYLAHARRAHAALPGSVEIGPEQGNYWAALTWAQEADQVLAAELAVTLRALFQSRGRLGEERSVVAALDRIGVRAPAAAAPPAAEAPAVHDEVERGRTLLVAGEHEQAVEPLAAALRVARAEGSDELAARAALHLGCAEACCGRYGGALRSLLVGLRLVEERGLTELVPLCLEGFAAVAAAGGDPVHAAQMQGAASALGGDGGDELLAGLRARNERALGEQLGEDAYRRAREEGARLSLAEAAAQARAGRAAGPTGA